MTLYAVWRKDTYDIIYNVNTADADGWIDGSGHEIEHKTSYQVDTETYTLPEPQVMGSTFLGWYTDVRLTRRITAIPRGSTGNMILYAKWMQ